jgi:tetratricopeptide (TPR) repeat protein
MYPHRFFPAFIVCAIAFPASHARAQSAGGDLDPATSKAYARSYELEATRDYAGALTVLDAVNPKDKGAYFFCLRNAWLNYLSAQHDTALGFYRIAAKLCPSAVQPLLGKMLPETVMGKWEDVAKTSDAILRVDPRNYTARTKLAYACHCLNRFQDAKRLYQDLVRDYPGDLSARSGLGWAQIKLDKKVDAVKEFKYILQVCPTHELANKGLDAAQTPKPAP